PTLLLRSVHHVPCGRLLAYMRRLLSLRAAVPHPPHGRAELPGYPFLAVKLPSVRPPPDGLHDRRAFRDARTLSRRQCPVTGRKRRLREDHEPDRYPNLLLSLSLQGAQPDLGNEATVSGVRRILALAGTLASLRFPLRPVPVGLEHRLGHPLTEMATA